MTTDFMRSSERHDAISERAAEFFERQRCGDWSEADGAELESWLAQSTLHHVAWLRMQGIAARADRLAALDALEHKQAASNARGGIRFRQFLIPLLAAASIAAIAPFAIPLVNSLLEPAARSFSTDVGGRTLLRFVDGTEFELNTDTAVRYRMTNHERVVWLDKGEAWFHVAHNAANPFMLIVGKHEVRDLGTEFVARRAAGNVDVALLNGRASLSTDGMQTAMLRPGDEAVATNSSVSVERKTPQELADELAWRRGMLVFRDTRLDEAVREINRYSTVKLVITDPSIAGLKFNGEIKNDNLQDFLGLAQIMMQLRADREGKNILLSRAAPERARRSAHARLINDAVRQ